MASDGLGVFEDFGLAATVVVGPSRTLSIPGTGFYNRQYLGDGKTQKPSFGISCGGCVGASFGALIGLAILEKVIESGNAGSIVLFFAVALGGYVVWKLVRTSTRPSSAPHPNYEALGREVNLMYIALAAPIKDELRKTRGATAYDAVFEQAFEDLICQFAVLDGTIVPAEAEVFLGIFKILHPRAHAGLRAENIVALLKSHLQAAPEIFKRPYPPPLLLKLAQSAGEPFATNLLELMCKVALQVALADGPLSPAETAELDVLRVGSTVIGRSRTADRFAPGTSADTTEIAIPGVTDQTVAGEARQLGQGVALILDNPLWMC